MKRIGTPNAWVAGLLAFFLPHCGIAQLYNGQVKKFLFIVLVLNIGSTAAAIILFPSFSGFLTAVVLGAIIWLGIVIDAVISARRLKEIQLRWYNSRRIYFAIACLCITSSFFLRGHLREHHFEAFKIPTSAMLPTLSIGDHMYTKKIDIPETVVKKGDIVVFTLPDDPKTEDLDESATTILKRIIALPGDTVEVYRTAVVLNGKRLKEPYAIWNSGGIKSFPERTVPEGTIFLLGDNRDYTRDSRYWQEPFLPIERVEGIVYYVYWNSEFDFDRVGPLE